MKETIQLPDFTGKNKIGDDSLPPEESDVSREINEVASPVENKKNEGLGPNSLVK